MWFVWSQVRQRSPARSHAHMRSREEATRLQHDQGSRPRDRGRSVRGQQTVTRSGVDIDFAWCGQNGVVVEQQRRLEQLASKAQRVHSGYPIRETSEQSGARRRPLADAAARFAQSGLCAVSVLPAAIQRDGRHTPHSQVQGHSQSTQATANSTNARSRADRSRRP